MNKQSTGLPQASLQTPPEQRVVGQISGNDPGPTLIVMTMIHGNEPAGYHAAQRVLQRLQREALPLRGDLVALTGNLSAVREKTRYIDEDMNRHWTPHTVAALRQHHRPDEPAEAQQRRELIDALSAVIRRARGPIHFVDLHTSSADGPPFLTVGDTLRNRSFALNFPLPIMLGLEEQVDGSLLEYLNNHGFVTMGVEAGGHDSAQAVNHHEAVLWLALRTTGLIDEAPEEVHQRSRRLLEQASRGTPRVLEVRYRHAVDPQSRFRMEPGFVNFHPTEKGRLLAQDRAGPVHAPERGRLLLPLYQGKGDDGFFIAREVGAPWLRISSVLRRLQLGRLIRLLPGIRRHPGGTEVLVVNTRIACWFPLEAFHLFGYRKLRRVGAALLVTRRRYDLAPPPRIRFP